MQPNLKSSPNILIAFAIDNPFVKPLAVTLVSLLETNTDNNLIIALFSANLTKENLSFLSKIVERYNQKFKFYDVDIKPLQNLHVSDRISHASYYRLMMPELLDSKLSKLIYLDADLIVTGNILPLWKTDLSDFVIGAIQDIAGCEWKLWNVHNYPSDYLYFNAGVLLINLQKWREGEFSEKIINYISQNKEKCLFHDQDGLNAILFENRKVLSPIWNQQIGLHYIKQKILLEIYSSNEIRNALNEPKIIHFNGSEKPWNFVSKHPWKKKFNTYIKKAGVEFKYDKSLKKRLKKTLYLIFGWARINRYYHSKV